MLVNDNCFLPSLQAQAQDTYRLGAWHIQSGVSLVTTTEDFGDQKQQAYLQYELAAAIQVGAQLSLSPALLYLQGLATPQPFHEIERRPDGTIIREARGEITPNDALALGVQARKCFGTGTLRPHLGLQGYLMSNSLSEDGVLFGARVGADYLLSRRWVVGVEGQWNNRSTGGELWQMYGVGVFVGYGLGR